MQWPRGRKRNSSRIWPRVRDEGRHRQAGLGRSGSSERVAAREPVAAQGRATRGEPGHRPAHRASGRPDEPSCLPQDVVEGVGLAGIEGAALLDGFADPAEEVRGIEAAVLARLDGRRAGQLAGRLAGRTARRLVGPALERRSRQTVRPAGPGAGAAARAISRWSRSWSIRRNWLSRAT